MTTKFYPIGVNVHRVHPHYTVMTIYAIGWRTSGTNWS